MIIDGIEVQETPITMLALGCGCFPVVPGHGHAIGDAVDCADCARPTTVFHLVATSVLA